MSGVSRWGVLAAGRRAVLLSLIGLCASALVACGGGGGELGTWEAGAAPVGETASSGEWTITIIGPPETAKVVGRTLTYQAQGTYLIIPLEVSNTSAEQRLVSGDVLKLYHGGERAPLGEDGAQFAYLYQEKLDLLFYDPFQPGQTRTTAVLFDVATQAEGLELHLQAEGETGPAILDLGK